MQSKFLGKGFWYNVYDLGDGRVRKIRKSTKQTIVDTYQHFGLSVMWVRTLFMLLTSGPRVLADYHYLQTTADPKLIGSPTFTNGIGYDQEKVQVLGQVIAAADNATVETIIDRYIDNIISCWKYGFADTVFNFTINNGLDAHGQVVLLDFNEVTRNKAKVLFDMQTERWHQTYSVTKLNPEQKQYFNQQMQLRANPHAVEKLWRSSVT